jgi:deferrochelatase/peroxidase EfeB
VRASTIDHARWDRESLGTQAHVIGRFKVSGASLDLSDDDSQLDQPPSFATNPADVRVPINAHVRKANPAPRRSAPSDPPPWLPAHRRQRQRRARAA